MKNQNNKMVTEITELKKYLNSEFVKREEVVDLAVLALASGESAFFISPPGEGKTKTLSVLGELINGNFCARTFTAQTMAEDLLGAIDPVEYQKTGKWIRKFDSFATADFALADEPYKAEHANQVLLELQASRMVDGKPVPIQAMFGASNELPPAKLEASWDRWGLRLSIPRLTQAGDLMALLDCKAGETPKPTINLTVDDFRAISKEALKMSTALPQKIKEKIVQICLQLQKSEIDASPRRIKLLTKVAAAQALLNGRSQVILKDLAVAKFIFWQKLEDIETVNNIVNSLVDPLAGEILNLKALYEDLQQRLTTFEQDLRDVYKNNGNPFEFTTEVRNCTLKLKKQLAEINKKADTPIDFLTAKKLDSIAEELMDRSTKALSNR